MIAGHVMAGKKPRNFSIEYAQRIARGATLGISRSQARGHARKSETPVRTLSKRAKRDADSVKLDKVVIGLDRNKSLSKAIKDAGLSRKQFNRLSRTLRYVEVSQRGRTGTARQAEAELPSSSGGNLAGRFTGRNLELVRAYRGELGRAITAYANGDRDAFASLKKFRGKSVTTETGHKIRLITSERTLKRRFADPGGEGGTRQFSPFIETFKHSAQV